MRTIRLTVSSVDISKQSEPEFQKEFTERLVKGGFNLQDPIIRQERNDVYAVDFIQFRYSWLDKFDVQLEYLSWRIWKWFKINILR